MKKGEITFSILSIPFDFLMLLVAGISTYALRTRILVNYRPVLFDLNLPFARYLGLVSLVSLFFIIMYALAGLYNLRSTRRIVEEFSRVVMASSAGIMVVIVMIFLRQELFDSRFLVLGFWLLAIFWVIVGRCIVRSVQRFVMGKYMFGVHRVLVIGNDHVSQTITREIKNDLLSGYTVIGQLPDPEINEVQAIHQISHVDEIILANPNYAAGRVLELIDYCNEHHLVFKFIPNMHQALTTNLAVDHIMGVPTIELRRTALNGWGQVLKRTIDLVVAGVGLIVLAPVFLVIGFVIKLDSPGPVLVKLDRISRNRMFKLYKFRSMIEHAERYKEALMSLNERRDGPLFKMKNDPRITRVGRILRKYRLDELPQLINVVRGHMSLVGPRPHQPDEIARYQKHHRRVLAIKAGATGIAQISGSSDLSFEEEVALDTLYIEHWTLLQDFKIITLTALKMFRDHSAV